MNLWQHSACETAALIKHKEVSCVEVVRSHLDRLDVVDQLINAVPIILSNEAMAQAVEIDNQHKNKDDALPLLGVPITIKINVDQIGQANSDGMIAFKDNIANLDSPVVKNLKDAGAVIIGQTNTPEFSIRWFTGNDLHGLTLNPWNKTLTPGGSSGAAAAAVTSGIGCIAHGNDMGGSLRYPAYSCGAYTIKPSFGRIANANPSTGNGRPPMSQLLSVQGPIARSIGDLELALKVMSRASSLDPDWQNGQCMERGLARSKKIAFQTDPFGAGVDSEVNEAMEEAKWAFIDAGYELVEVKLPLASEAANAWGRITMSEVNVMMTDTLEKHGTDSLMQNIETMHSFFGKSDVNRLMQDLYLRNQARLAWNSLFDQYAAVLMPVSSVKPFSNNIDFEKPEYLNDILRHLRFAYLINYLGLPSVAVPTSVRNNSPMGVQIVGAPNDDFGILSIAKHLEERCIINYKSLWDKL